MKFDWRGENKTAEVGNSSIAHLVSLTQRLYFNFTHGMHMQHRKTANVPLRFLVARDGSL